MKLHILGIGGTFMGGIAALAQSLGHQVSGADRGVYPPMSTQLARLGVTVHEGYDPGQFEPRPDLVIIGNALARGNLAVEAVLDRDIPYTSGAQWLAENVLRERWVLAVAGTHGKTTTASILAWMLADAGLDPGFLIGGVPENFGTSARLGTAPFFVVEADEYDTAFFDKRSKFVHYRPRTAVLNNLEYDHADIFPDVAAIQRQFHHFVRTIPGNGRLIVNAADPRLAEVLAMGRWTPVEYFDPPVGPARCSPAWRLRAAAADYSEFEVTGEGAPTGRVGWALAGRHNALNALAAALAARHAGVPLARSLASLGRFRPVRRRMELRGVVGGVHVYDDFAHHPTAIRATLETGRSRTGDHRLVAVFEPRSNSMRMGAHRAALAEALAPADRIYVLEPGGLGWDLRGALRGLGAKVQAFPDVAGILDALVPELETGDHVIIMSNGSFDGIHQRLMERLPR